MLPTLSKLAAALVAAPSAPIPARGFYLGLAIFFLIGATTAYALAERVVKEAFFAGIAAPAIIASIISGATGAQLQGPPQKPPAAGTASKGAWAFQLGFSSAFAEEAKQDTKSNEPSSGQGTEPTPATEEEAKFKYSIVSLPSGATDWRTKDDGIRLVLKESGGKLLHYKLPVGYSQLQVTTDKPITEIKMEASGTSSKVLPLRSNEGGKILIHPYVETEKDFWWALGGKGSPIVKNLSAQFVQGQEP